MRSTLPGGVLGEGRAVHHLSFVLLRVPSCSCEWCLFESAPTSSPQWYIQPVVCSVSGTVRCIHSVLRTYLRTGTRVHQRAHSPELNGEYGPSGTEQLAGSCTVPGVRAAHGLGVRVKS